MQKILSVGKNSSVGAQLRFPAKEPKGRDGMICAEN